MSRMLGQLRIDLVALTGKFEANFKTAQGTLDKFGVAATRIGRVASGALSRIGNVFGSIKSAVFSLSGAVAAMAAFVGGAQLARSFNEAAGMVDDLGKKARVLGLSVETLSVLRLAAEESGVEFEGLTKIVGKASQNIAEYLRTGTGEAGKAIQSLGIQVRDANGNVRSMTDLLPEFAAKFETIADPAARLDLATAVFGRAGGAQFVQWVEDSGGFMKNLAEQTERAAQLGVLFNEGQFQRLKAYNDAVGRLSIAWLGIRVRIMDELAPALADLANRTSVAMAKVGEFGANLASVFREALTGNAGTEDGSGFISRKTLAFLVESTFGYLWAEVSTRVQFFFARVWQLIKNGAAALLGDFGDALTGGIAEATGLLGELLNQAAELVGTVAKKIGAKIGEAGSSLGSAWAKTGEQLAGYGSELEQVRADSYAAFVASIRQINLLGERYRGLRDAAAGYGETVEALAETSGRVATTWDEFFAGMKAAYRDLAQETSDYASLGRNAFATMTNGISSGLSSALAKGEASFRNFGKTALGVLADVLQGVTQMILQFYIARAVLGIAGVVAPALAGGTGGDQNFIGPLQPDALAADGGVFRMGNGASAGVLNGPAAFNFTDKVGVAGEAGAEAAFAPLRKIGGELGVKSIPGDVTVQIIDQRSGGSRPEVSQTRDGDGKQTIRVLIRDEVRRGIADGDFDRSLGTTFGISRKGVRR